MIATIATVCLTASTANINHESRAPTFAQRVGMGLRVPGAEPTSLPSGMNYGIPDDLPRRQLYNNNGEAAALGRRLYTRLRQPNGKAPRKQLV